MATVAFLLAAGESTRMGRPKPLLPWAGTTLVEWQVRQLRDAGCDQVVAVIGSHAHEVRSSLKDSGAISVLNPEYQTGRASSVRAAASYLEAALSANPEQATLTTMVLLNVDQPRPAWVTRRLLSVARQSNAGIVSPVYRGRGGHPIVLAGRLLGELLEVEESTLGLRAVTQTHEAETIRVEFANSCVIVDLNTPEEYESALADFGRGEWREESEGHYRAVKKS